MRTPYQPQRVLLTGAAGVVGRFLLPELASLGAPLRLLAHRSPVPGLLRRADLEMRAGDLGRPSTLRGVAEGCDVVVHAAARTGFGSLSRDAQRQVNVEGTAALLREARSAGARVFVLVGYAGTVQERDDRSEPVDEDTPPEGEYAADYVRTKYETEAMTLEANGQGGMRTLVVSPGVLLHRDAPTLLSGLIGLFAGGELPFRLLEDVWLATSDAADVARCVAAAVERGPGGRRYFAAGECLRLGELYDRLSGLTGVPPPRRRLPDLLVEELGLLSPVLPRGSFLRQMILPRDLAAHLRRLAPLESRRTRETLGFRPTPLEDTLRSMLGPLVAAPDCGAAGEGLS